MTLFIDFIKVDSIRTGMIKMEAEEENIIIESYDEDGGSNISDE